MEFLGNMPAVCNKILKLIHDNLCILSMKNYLMKYIFITYTEIHTKDMAEKWLREMEKMKGWQTIFKQHESEVTKKSDLLVVICHWLLTFKKGFLCLHDVILKFVFFLRISN